MLRAYGWEEGSRNNLLRGVYASPDRDRALSYYTVQNLIERRKGTSSSHCSVVRNNYMLCDQHTCRFHSSKTFSFRTFQIAD
jgi:hypothetical protein